MCAIGREWRNRTDKEEIGWLGSISVESYGHFEFFRGSPRPGPGQGQQYIELQGLLYWYVWDRVCVGVLGWKKRRT